MLKHLVSYGAASLLLMGSVTCFAQSTAEIYVAKCQMCHAPDGSAGTPAGKAMKTRPVKSPDFLKESDMDLIAIIKNGKNKMPAFAGKLTDSQMTDLVAYIHALQKK